VELFALSLPTIGRGRYLCELSLLSCGLSRHIGSPHDFFREEEGWLRREEEMGLNRDSNGCWSGGQKQVDNVQLFWSRRDQV